MQPGRHRQRPARDIVARPQAVADRVQEALRDLLRSIHRHLRRRVRQRRVGDARQESAAVFLQSAIGNTLQRRRDLQPHHGVDETA
ncbi:hypothetical protein G6F63_016442 [Rhizopus arrhizus]|nr:hypothetical protein G6F63_016442 [Rhizopus arrhizus]